VESSAAGAGGCGVEPIQHPLDLGEEVAHHGGRIGDGGGAAFDAQANPLRLVAPTGFDDGIGLRVTALGGLQLEIGQRTVLQGRPGMAW